MRSLRWTIDWARLEPRPGHWDDGFAAFVTEVLRAARAEGIDVWAVLHDGPLPGWFSEDEGGFHDRTGRGRTWPRHVDRVAEAFGDHVTAWVPVLDPFTIAADGYLEARRPPGRADELRFAEALEELHLVSHEALRLLRSGDPLVACCIDTEPAHGGVHTREPDERDAARSRAASAERLRLGTWLRTLNDGVVSIPGRAEIEIDGLAGGYDVVGFTYRGARTVFADGTDGPYPADAPVAADGRAPWAEGLGEVGAAPGRRAAPPTARPARHRAHRRRRRLAGRAARRHRRRAGRRRRRRRAAHRRVLGVRHRRLDTRVRPRPSPTGWSSRSRDRRPSATTFHDRLGRPWDADRVSDAQTRAKDEAGRHAAGYVTDGMKVGLGTGSTVHFTILELGDRRPRHRVHRHLEGQTDELATSLGLTVVTPDEIGALDIAIDGADEVDPAFNLTKGGGGAHTREKIVEPR